MYYPYNLFENYRDLTKKQRPIPYFCILMNVFNNILETIGNTPLVKVNKMCQSLPCDVYVKVETTNPGNSIKDRMALKMIEDAEKSGLLVPGGTIVEGTSGNTGMGLAIAAVIKGYKCIFTTTDKQSKEKVDALKAFGAEVIVCPTDVDPEDPRSYYSVSSRLASEIPNAWKPNQYDNPSNALAHYEQTGPEIWDQTDGKITHLVVGAGTGGTISGTGKFLKEQNPNIKIIGIDTYGSVFKKYKETGIFDKNEIYPYITEGIGEDFLPANVNFDIIDHFEKVTDKDAAIFTRKIAREEGIFAGNSAGSAMAGLLQIKDQFKKGDVVVVIFHDHGTRYLGKMFNDDWMRDRGFIEPTPIKTALDLIRSHEHLPLVKINTTENCATALAKMEKYNISQMPVSNSNGEFVGSIEDKHLFSCLLKNSDLKSAVIEQIMQKPLPIVHFNTSIKEVSEKIGKDTPAVLVMDLGGNWHIINQFDVIQAVE
jgi:cystathionine beta-synthase